MIRILENIKTEKPQMELKENFFTDIIDKFKNYIEKNREDKKIQSIMKEIQSNGGDLDAYFDKLVPSEGKADTVAGELIRAISRIGYRSYNDGDLWFMGYGIETCASSVAYLFDNGYNAIIEKMAKLSEKIYTPTELDIKTIENDYDKYIEEISNGIIQEIIDNPKLLTQPNDIDSRNYSTSIIEDYFPVWDYEHEIPYEIERHIEVGNIKGSDLEYEVQSWDNCHDAQFTSFSMMIYEVGADEWNELNDQVPQNFEAYIDELNDEYGDPDMEDEDNEEWDDEEDY